MPCWTDEAREKNATHSKAWFCQQDRQQPCQAGLMHAGLHPFWLFHAACIFDHTLVSPLPHFGILSSTLWYPLFHTLVSSQAGIAFWLLHAGLHPFWLFHAACIFDHTLVSPLPHFGIPSSTLWYPLFHTLVSLTWYPLFHLVFPGWHRFLAFAQACMLFWIFHQAASLFRFCTGLHRFLAFSPGLHRLHPHFGISSSTLWYPLFHTLVSSLPHFGIPSSTLWYPLSLTWYLFHLVFPGGYRFLAFARLTFFAFFTQVGMLFCFCTQACILFGFFTRLASLITLWYPLFHTLVSPLPHFGILSSTLWYPLFHTLVSSQAGIAFWLLHAGLHPFWLFHAACIFDHTLVSPLPHFGIPSSTLWYPLFHTLVSLTWYPLFHLVFPGWHRFLAFAQACMLFWIFHQAASLFRFCTGLHRFLAFSPGLHRLHPHFGISSSTLWYPLFHTLVSSLPHFGIPSSTLWYPLSLTWYLFHLVFPGGYRFLAFARLTFFAFFTQVGMLFCFCTQACILFGFFTRLASLITLWYPLFHTLVSPLPHFGILSSTLWYPLFHTLVSSQAGIAFWLLHAGLHPFWLFHAACIFDHTLVSPLPHFGIPSSTLWYPLFHTLVSLTWYPLFHLVFPGWHRFLAFAQACMLFWIFHQAASLFRFCTGLHRFLAFSPGLHRLHPHFGISSSTLWYPLFHTLVSSLPHFGIPSSTLWYPLSLTWYLFHLVFPGGYRFLAFARLTFFAFFTQVGMLFCFCTQACILFGFFTRLASLITLWYPLFHALVSPLPHFGILSSTLWYPLFHTLVSSQAGIAFWLLHAGLHPFWLFHAACIFDHTLVSPLPHFGIPSSTLWYPLFHTLVSLTWYPLFHLVSPGWHRFLAFAQACMLFWIFHQAASLFRFCTGLHRFLAFSPGLHRLHPHFGISSSTLWYPLFHTLVSSLPHFGIPSSTLWYPLSLTWYLFHLVFPGGYRFLAFARLTFFAFFTQVGMLFCFCTQACILFGFFTRLASLITLWYPLFHTLVSPLPHFGILSSTLWYPLFHTLVSSQAGIAFWLLHAGLHPFWLFL